MLNSKTSFRSPSLFKHDDLLMTADLITIIIINKCGSDVGSHTFTKYEARAKRSHAQSKQCHNHPFHSRVPRRCVQISGTNLVNWE